MTVDARIKKAQGNKDYWYGELNSLGVEPKSDNEISNAKELKDLTDNIKQVLYQDYKTAYSRKSEAIDESHFDHII